MPIVQSSVEARRLNNSGEYGPYLAANGHLMMANLRFPKNETEDSTGEREYRIGDEIKFDSWSAWCARGCKACQEGYPLEDW